MQHNPLYPHQTSTRIATQTTILADGSYRTIRNTSTPHPTVPQNTSSSACPPSSNAIRKPIEIVVDQTLLPEIEVRLETSTENIVSIHINRRQPPVVALPSAILPSALLGSAPRGDSGGVRRSGAVRLQHRSGLGGRATAGGASGMESVDVSFVGLDGQDDCGYVGGGD